MDKHTIQVLEYEKVLGLIAHRTSTEPGRQRALALTPFADPSEVRRRLTMISEMKSLLEWGKTPPLAAVEDVGKAISRARVPGAVLDAGTILLIGVLARTSRLVREFLYASRGEAPHLWGIASGLHRLNDLEAGIDAAIDEDTNVKDTASGKLKKIRRDKARVSARIASTLKDILAKENLQSHLQDSIVTIRNGRYVIPVRTEAKSKLTGIVHDTSQSGATVFIEPMATVSLNNTLRGLELEEKDEILRILSDLTSAIGHVASELVVNLEVLTEIDVINAAARFSMDFSCTEPATNLDGRTAIKGGRHPILVEVRQSQDGGSAVPLDITLAGRGHGLLITGPNAGGKTVALKTVGILTLLARTGLHIPCEDGTDIGLFGKVYADIGDEQSIELNLSTFSSHMKNIVGILGDSDSDSLILLDEVGAGTDPLEGASIARTVIEELLRKGGSIVATTHHMSLKIFAHENPLLENASMEFDSENLRPTYRLIQGIPGASHAFEIASRLGLGDDLLARARDYCGNERVRFEDLTRDLLERMRNLAIEEAGVEAKRKKIDKVLADYETRLEEIKKHGRQIKKQALREAKYVVDDARRTVSKLVKDLREKEPPPQKAKQIENEIRQKADRIDKAIERIGAGEDRRRRLQEPNVGARAYIRPLSREGIIISQPDEKGRIQVVVGAMRAEVGVGDLFEPQEAAKPAKASSLTYEAREVPSEIDVRGMTSEDAWEAVDKYLDEASLYGYDSVRVIHGKGKGVLSKRIREMLSTHPRAAGHRFGEIGEGGTGVTIVQIEKG